MHKRILIILLAVVVLLNLAAWFIPGLCDWYTLYITPVWYNSFGRLANIFPFSVGEIMLGFAVVLVCLAALFGILLVFLRKKEGYRRFTAVFYRIFAYIFVMVCLVMTLNCSMLYHCEPLDPNPNAAYREYTIEELELMRNHIVAQCNYYSCLVERDAEGYLVYSGDMQETAKRALHNISDQYPKLSGYYPDVKHMALSNLMSQAYMAGYYFPFSMEANCNGNMYISNYPEVYCHELSHLHGYIHEDEANFLSFLACKESDDVFFIYCGYLSVLNYVNNAYWESIDGDIERYMAQPSVNQFVNTDNIFLLEKTWEEVEETAVFATDTIDAVSDRFTETSLQLNGVKEGLARYDKVVDLLLQYYDGILYTDGP